MLEITAKLENAKAFLGESSTHAFELAPMYLASYKERTEGCMNQVDKLYDALKCAGILDENSSSCMKLKMDRKDSDGNGLIFTAADGSHSNPLSVWLQSLNMACSLDGGIISICLNDDFFEGRGRGSFRALLDQLLPWKDSFLMLLFVPEKHLETSEKKLGQLTFLECVECPCPTAKEYLELAIETLKAYGLTFNRGNSAILLNILEKEYEGITENVINLSMRELAWRYATREASIGALLRGGVVEGHIHHKAESHKVQLGFNLNKEESKNESCEYYVV